jgi:transcriptional regulator with XRE-family HTH domain
VQIVDIAINIKRLRQKRGLTLESLARRAGVTKGYLSQVENFRTTSSISTLYRIAEALGVRPAELLAPNTETKAYVVTRNGEGIAVEREYPESGFRYRALALEKSAKLMDPFLLEIPPGSRRKNVKTDGDEFCHVQEGEIEFFLGKERITLRAGDSLYFDGQVPHHPENRKGRKAVLLVIYCVQKE